MASPVKSADRTVLILEAFAEALEPLALRARGRLQGREQVIGIEVGQVGHVLLFHEIAQSGQFLHEPHDDLREQPLQRLAGGRTSFLEDRFAPGAPIDPIEHQAVQVNVQVGRRAGE